MGLTEKTLELIVVSNGKQRFQFGRNEQQVRFIRAVQGHTMKCVDSDLLLEKIEDPF
jgi:RNA:NAD 2'-phosphotransferase (TPT1/KptA family)